jgi:hypothetical protein
MQSFLAIPKLRELGFDIKSDNRVLGCPIQWSRHPKIFLRVVPKAGDSIRKVILYVARYTTPGDDLRSGYYEPKHEIILANGPSVFTKALKWLEGTGFEYAENCLREENLQIAKERAELESRHNYAEEFCRGETPLDPGHSWTQFTQIGLDGVPRVTGMQFSVTLKGPAAKVAERWLELRPHIQKAIK